MRILKEMLQHPDLSGPVHLASHLILVIVRDSEPLGVRCNAGGGSKLSENNRLQHLLKHSIKILI